MSRISIKNVLRSGCLGGRVIGLFRSILSIHWFYDRGRCFHFNRLLIIMFDFIPIDTFMLQIIIPFLGVVLVIIWFDKFWIIFISLHFCIQMLDPNLFLRADLYSKNTL